MPGVLSRRSLTEIYQDAVNIAVWETEISPKLESAVKAVMASSPDLRLSEVISIKSAEDQLQKILGADDASVELRNDVLELVDMFCCLFWPSKNGAEARNVESCDVSSISC